MASDPINDEIHAVREALSLASGDDIRRIAEAARARQTASGKKTVRLAPRKATAGRKSSSSHPTTSARD
jgi:hypothetical protein